MNATRILGIALFATVAIGVYSSLHYYVWARLGRDVMLGESWRRGVAAVLMAIAIGVPAGAIGARLLGSGSSKPIAYLTFGWMGFGFFLAVGLGGADLIRGLASLGVWVVGLFASGEAGPVDPARRLFFARAIAGGATLVATSTVARGVAAAGDIEVKEIPVKLPRLPRELEGFTIVQLTDIHAGPIIGARAIRGMVEKANALKPDLVAVTGDLVDGPVKRLGEDVRPLGELSARFGRFFITGNHEYYSGADEWLAFVAALGIRPLRNERLSVGDQASFDLVGIDDWSSTGMLPGHGPDLKKAFAGRDPERECVLLAHQPRGIDQAVKLGAGLQLSGHTHGGQIQPFGLLVGLTQPYMSGLHTHREGEQSGQIYVSRGTGFWGPPMRVLAPAEITKIVLTRG